jgi:hypothetical protein
MLSDGKDAVGDVAYERHRPELTLLHQLKHTVRPCWSNWGIRASAYLNMSAGNSETISSAAAWNTDSRGCAATSVTSSDWSHFPARSGDSVRAVAPAGWPRPPPYRPMKCFPMYRFVSGLSVFPFR